MPVGIQSGGCTASKFQNGMKTFSVVIEFNKFLNRAFKLGYTKVLTEESVVQREVLDFYPI